MPTDPKPYNWPDIPSLHPETQIYTGRRSTDEAPANFKFTLLALAQFILSLITTKPLRYTFSKQSGSNIEVTLPAGISFPPNNNIYVYVEGRGLMFWGEGITRQNNNFNFEWPLDEESVQIVIYQ